MEANGGRYVPALPPRVALDATGAGDVFAGAWLAARSLAPEAHDWQHLAVAAAMASLSVTGRSISNVPGRRELCDVLLRLRGLPRH
jgi:sugar/nucleoside kinase (ribokinase family)